MRLETYNFVKKVPQNHYIKVLQNTFASLQNCFSLKIFFLSNAMAAFVQILSNMQIIIEKIRNLWWKIILANSGSKSTAGYISLAIGLWIVVIYLSFFNVSVYLVLVEHSPGYVLNSSFWKRVFLSVSWVWFFNVFWRFFRCSTTVFKCVL